MSLMPAASVEGLRNPDAVRKAIEALWRDYLSQQPADIGPPLLVIRSNVAYQAGTTQQTLTAAYGQHINEMAAHR